MWMGALQQRARRFDCDEDGGILAKIARDSILCASAEFGGTRNM
jgi:hypothetical protein